MSQETNPKPSFRIIFIDGSPFVVTKYSGKNARSLYRAILEVHERTYWDKYHYYVPGYPEPISFVDYNMAIVLSIITRMFTNGKSSTIYLKSRNELWVA